MMRAPEKKRSEVPMTDPGVAMGATIGAAMSVEKRHGKKR
jgi:predicted phosphoribosyltransferase